MVFPFGWLTRPRCTRAAACPIGARPDRRAQDGATDRRASGVGLTTRTRVPPRSTWYSVCGAEIGHRLDARRAARRAPLPGDERDPLRPQRQQARRVGRAADRRAAGHERAALEPERRPPTRPCPAAGCSARRSPPRRRWPAARRGPRPCRPAARCPAAITTSRSDMASASSWSCVTKSVVRPSRCCNCRISSRTSARSFASRLESGSSSRNTAGLMTSARASATRCCWPPDSSRGRRCGEMVEPHEAERLDDAAVALGPADLPHLEPEADILARRSYAGTARRTGTPCRCRGRRPARA